MSTTFDDRRQQDVRRKSFGNEREGGKTEMETTRAHVTVKPINSSLGSESKGKKNQKKKTPCTRACTRFVRRGRTQENVRFSWGRRKWRGTCKRGARASVIRTETVSFAANVRWFADASGGLRGLSRRTGGEHDKSPLLLPRGRQFIQITRAEFKY